MAAASDVDNFADILVSGQERRSSSKPWRDVEIGHHYDKTPASEVGVPLEWGHAEWCEVGPRCDQDMAPVNGYARSPCAALTTSLKSHTVSPVPANGARHGGLGWRIRFGIDVGTKDDVERLWEKSFMKHAAGEGPLADVPCRAGHDLLHGRPLGGPTTT